MGTRERLSFGLVSPADRHVFKTDPQMLSFTEEKVGLVNAKIEQLHLRIVNSTP